MVEFKDILDIFTGIDVLTLAKTIFQPSIGRSAFINNLIQYSLILGVIYIVGKYLVYRPYLDPLNQLPGPSFDHTIPFMGHLPQVAKKEWGVTFREWTEKYGQIFRVNITGNLPIVFVSDPGLLKHILSNDEYEFSRPEFAKQLIGLFLGRGLPLLDNDIHRSRRKIIYPALGLNSVREMLPCIMPPTREMVRIWRKRCAASDSPTEIIVSDDMVFLTMELTGATIFGQKFNCLKNPDEDPVSRAYLDMSREESPIAAMIVMLYPWLINMPLKRLAQLKADSDLLKKTTRELVIKTSQLPDLHERKDLMSLLIKQVDEVTGKGLTHEELQNECLLFLGAGHDTTSSVLSFALHELAKNQQVQEELREEINKAFPNLSHEEDATDIPEYDDINKLPYFANFFKEVLRVSPPLTLLVREARQDFVWNGNVFSKGTQFFGSTTVGHFDKKYWGNDSHEFLPSRWDRAPANNISPYVYLPFSNGPRNCIGYRLATTMTKTVIISLVKNFKFTLKPNFEIKKSFQFALKPTPNMTLMVESI